jgi:chemotaxis protein CheZ
MRVLQEQLAKGTHSPSSVADSWQQCLDQIEGHTFEVIASQEFQDLTQQKLHKIAASLQDFERRLVDLLIIFKIKEDQSDPSGNVELLKSLHDASVADNNKQDLVDQLLAEFGM